MNTKYEPFVLLVVLVAILVGVLMALPAPQPIVLAAADSGMSYKHDVYVPIAIIPEGIVNGPGDCLGDGQDSDHYGGRGDSGGSYDYCLLAPARTTMLDILTKTVRTIVETVTSTPVSTNTPVIIIDDGGVDLPSTGTPVPTETTVVVTSTPAPTGTPMPTEKVKCNNGFGDGPDASCKIHGNGANQDNNSQQQNGHVPGGANNPNHQDSTGLLLVIVYMQIARGWWKRHYMGTMTFDEVLAFREGGCDVEIKE